MFAPSIPEEPNHVNTNTINRHSIGMLVAAALLAGCAALPASAPEDAVRARAQARWDAVIAGDWEKAYGFATPAYRAALDLHQFRVRHDALIKHRKASVFDVACESDTLCKVKMQVTFTPPQDIPTPDLTTVIEERWVAEDGQWWRYAEF